MQQTSPKGAREKHTRRQKTMVKSYSEPFQIQQSNALDGEQSWESDMWAVPVRGIPRLSATCGSLEDVGRSRELAMGGDAAGQDDEQGRNDHLQLSLDANRRSMSAATAISAMRVQRGEEVGELQMGQEESSTSTSTSKALLVKRSSTVPASSSMGKKDAQHLAPPGLTVSTGVRRISSDGSAPGSPTMSRQNTDKGRHSKLKASLAQLSEESLPAQKLSTVELLQVPEERYRLRIAQVFNSMVVDHHVNIDMSEEFLSRIGHREPKQLWIEEIARGITRAGFYDREDASELAFQYKDRFVQDVEATFGGLDPSMQCSSEAAESLFGQIRTRTLPGVALQAKCWFGLRQHQNSKEPPDDDSAMMSVARLEGIMKVRDILIDHAGFTPAEFKRIQATFNRYDIDKDGVLSAQGMMLGLTWTGADPDYSRSVCTEPSFKEEEFIQKIKEFFHLEEERIHAAFEACEGNKDGKLERRDLPNFFEELGHLSATQEIIGEALEASGMSMRQRVNFEDIYQVFMRFRERNGFLQAELEEIEDAFKKLDHDGSGSMDASELETAVHWLGYPSSFAIVREVLELYDIDESGELELVEMHGFIARYRDRHEADIRRVFAKHANGGVSSKSMPVTSVKPALFDLCFMPAQARLASLTRGLKEVSLREFRRMVTTCRQEVATKARENQCFSDLEVRQFRAKFEERLSGDEEEIATANIPNLLEELYPDIRSNMNTHARARKLLEASDANGDGKLDFQEFLRMMRLFRYEVRSQELATEREVMTETGFTRDEVREFHTVFDVFDEDASGEISPDEFESMIQQFVPVTKQAAHKLLEKMRDIGLDGSRELGFIDFLRIMRVVADELSDPPAKSVSGTPHAGVSGSA